MYVSKARDTMNTARKGFLEKSPFREYEDRGITPRRSLFTAMRVGRKKSCVES